mgnify:CR=1 FL=1
MNGFLIAAVVALVAGSAFFSSAEIAYNSASPHKLRAKAEAGDKRALLAQSINEHYTQALSTILMGNNLVNIATTAIITVLLVDALGPKGQGYAELLTTVILLIFGEIIPKILGVEYCNRLVLSYGAPLRFFITLFKPVVWVVGKLVDGLSRLWTKEEAEPSMTDEELVMVVDSIQDEGVITEDEGELIKSAIEFADITAHEIMIPRVDVLAVDVDDSVEEFLASEGIDHYTRIPVYEENIDHIVGIVNVKQVLQLALDPAKRGSINLRELMTEPKFVHMTKSIDDLLKELRDEGRNMAVVLDGYGGTAGILTMEDILEELVGDIWDEADEVEPDVTEMGENEFLLDGDMNIYDAFESVGYEPDEEFDSEYNTLGGWVTEMLDRFPQPGDTFTHDGLQVTVMSVDEHRVEQVKIVVDQPEDGKEE